MQRRIIKGERTEAFALERATPDDYIRKYADKYLGIEDIKWLLKSEHGQIVSLEHIKHVVWTHRHGPA